VADTKPGVVRRYLTKFAAVMPSAATILNTGKKIIEAVGSTAIPGVTR